MMSLGLAGKWAAAGLLAIVPLNIGFRPGAIGAIFRRDDSHLQAVFKFAQVLRSLAQQ